MPADESPLLIAPEDLAQQDPGPETVLVDLSDASTYQSGHIPGAVHLDYESLLHAEPPILGLVPDVASLGQTLGAAGINASRYVIAYDDEGNGRATRLLWMLAALGHPAHAVVNGGLIAWRAAGLPVDSGWQAPVATSYKPRLEHPELIASCSDVLAAIDDPDTLILDNRSAEEFRGEWVRAERGGHIPGAIHLDWLHAMNHEGDLRLKPREQLRADFEAAGVTPDKRIITHCQTHHRSSLTLFALRYLGYERISGYAGSWSEWGNRHDTPIV